MANQGFCAWRGAKPQPITIVNNLNETIAGKALDAVQGKELNTKIATAQATASNALPKTSIKYSSTAPPVVNGAVWLKPRE